MAIAEDASAPASVHTASGSGVTFITTASFTPVANSLIVAIAESGSNTGGLVTCPVTDSLSSTWTLLKRANAPAGNGGSAEVWAMDAGASPAARTVTATGTGGTFATGVSLTVKVLTGALPVASCLGASATALNTTAYSIAITPGTLGSLLVGGLVDVISATGALTVNGITTAYQSFLDAGSTEKYAEFRATALTAVTGSPVTLGFTTTAGDGQNLVAVEILPAAGGAVAGIGRAQPGQTWLRRFHHRQVLLQPPAGIITLNGTATLAASSDTQLPAPAITLGSVATLPASALAASLATEGSTATLPAASGTLAPNVTQGANAALAGASSGISPDVTQGAIASPAASGAVTATVTEGALAPLASASGTITPNASQGSSAALAAQSGTVTPAVTQGAPAALPGASSLSSAVTQGAGTSLSGASSAISPAVTQGAVASLPASASITAKVTQLVTAGLAAVSTLIANTAGLISGTATMAASSALSSAVVQQAISVLPGQSGTVTPNVTQGANASLASGSTITPASTLIQRATAVLASVAQLIAQPFVKSAVTLTEQGLGGTVLAASAYGGIVAAAASPYAGNLTVVPSRYSGSLLVITQAYRGILQAQTTTYGGTLEQ